MTKEIESRISSIEKKVSQLEMVLNGILDILEKFDKNYLAESIRKVGDKVTQEEVVATRLKVREIINRELSKKE